MIVANKKNICKVSKGLKRHSQSNKCLNIKIAVAIKNLPKDKISMTK